jgi:aspartate/methionine/tyrosine aminotransferase
MVVVSDLHNPTGCAAGDAALARLAEEAARRDAWVLVDEVYRDFRPGPVGTARRAGDRVVAVSSLTKVYGLGRARLGWVLAPAPVVERMRSLINVVHGVDPAPLQPLFTAGLERADGLRGDALAAAARRWEIVRAWARRHPRLRLAEAAGGVSAWVGLPPGTTGTGIAARFAEAGVAVVPGSMFGDDSGFRMSFGVPEETLRAGLAIMDRVLEVL